jgi:glycosyltransferase involved in cell wall biosynthesis
MHKKYSIIIPAYNEAGGIGKVLEEILHSDYAGSFEIIVVDDHSSDETATVAAGYPVQVIRNVQNFGYGYSLKRGIAAAVHDAVIILDADGSYPIAEIPKLVAEYEKGFDMVVGARHGQYYRGSFSKRVGRFFFRVLSEFATGRHIPDINSGLRIFRKDAALRFFHTLSSGFSFTTTITLSFMLNAYAVTYLPIEYHKRKGHSKVRYVRDTLRSAQIIVEAIATYNPLKIFLLVAAMMCFTGVVAGVLALWHPWIALLAFLTVALALIVFALGLVAVFLKNKNGGI